MNCSMFDLEAHDVNVCIVRMVVSILVTVTAALLILSRDIC